MQDLYKFVVTDIHHVIEREATRDWKFSTAAIGKYIALVNLGGIGEYTINGNSFKVYENDVVLFPPHTDRLCSTDENSPWHFISIAFELKDFEGNDYVIKDCPMLIKGVGRKLADIFKDISAVWSSRPVAYYSLCCAHVQEMLCRLVQLKDAFISNPGHFEKIEIVKKYINDNYTKNISVDELADISGLSQSHFRKVFREVVGVSATQYAINLRINKAKDLLISGAANVSEAAFQSGFKDIYYFSSMFKKVTGENPSKFLK